jgi:hypothetical protein
MLFQFPFPPPPDMPLDPPGPAFQLLVCIRVPLLWFEMIVLLLPERWRNRIFELQFGWAAKGKDRP